MAGVSKTFGREKKSRCKYMGMGRLKKKPEAPQKKKKRGGWVWGGLGLIKGKKKQGEKKDLAVRKQGRGKDGSVRKEPHSGGKKENIKKS